ncbi:hypothetical protein Pmani_012470 [Petrolisthes manimaculis]|uniref:RNA-directed DNA polymerase n=1 Tax=Petrolisthes manimaculis TaxID=1843537 RepID=A0AAE1UD55_9EUCA|nr:hypothetical protein Pmani_012470 [Petrolisthes manimaculis]
MTKSRQALESDQAGSSGGGSLAEEQEDAPWASVTQLVIPTSHRQGIFELAHDGRFSGHLGVRKTFNRLAKKFYWPDVVPYAYAISTLSCSITHENPLIRLLTPQFLCAMLMFALLIDNMKRKKTFPHQAGSLQFSSQTSDPDDVRIGRDGIFRCDRTFAGEWCSPVTFVPKRDGSLRFCIVFHKVNAVTKKDSFPIPRIDDFVEARGNSKYLTKIDCLRGFWQVYH